jgi:hypothetical protein
MRRNRIHSTSASTPPTTATAAAAIAIQPATEELKT